MHNFDLICAVVWQLLKKEPSEHARLQFYACAMREENVLYKNGVHTGSAPLHKNNKQMNTNSCMHGYMLEPMHIDKASIFK